MSKPAQLLLASQSPRRQALLAQLGLSFEIIVPSIDESRSAGESPPHYALRLAREKALAGLKADPKPGPERIVLGADTIVVVDDEVLGKPRDREDALSQLERLSARFHVVLSAVAVVRAGSERPPRVAARLNRSRVWFRQLSPTEREAYWATGEPVDKAGSYAIQGLAARFISRIEGSYSGVMGLPLYETAELLAGAGLRPSAG